MNTENGLNYERLFEIAKDLKPLCDEWNAAWNETANSDFVPRLVDVTKKVNDAVDPYVAEIAALTNNSESTIRQVYCPKKDDFGSTWFRSQKGPAEFLRNVAAYESYNEKLWTQHSGLERPPTHVLNW